LTYIRFFTIFFLEVEEIHSPCLPIPKPPPNPPPTGKTCSASPRDRRSSSNASAFRRKQIAVEGQFTLPELARLSLEDQVFVVAFLRCHGTIKDMEQTFGVSYPTIKARLNRISSQLEFVETSPSPTRSEKRTDILARLQKGEIAPAEAIHALEALK
jgi:hypothetical protein